MKPKVIENLLKNRTINKIFETLFKEKNTGKPGLTISELSMKTGIERHRLAGILEVLAILGFLVVFEMGMMKVVAPAPLLLKMKNLLV